MYDRPEVGKSVTVTTDWSDVVETSTPTVRIVYGKGVHTGTVLKNNDWNDPASFNITTGRPEFPVANIPLHRVIDIQYVDGTEAAIVDDVDDDSETWSMSGSKGNEYVVTRRGDTWSCECVGWQYRSQCKHVNACKEEVLSRSK